MRNKYDEEALEKARGLAQLLLDSGMGFDHHGKSMRGTGFLGSKARARASYCPVGVYSYEEAREIGLKPSYELQNAMREMLLIRHEEHQERRRKEQKASFFSSKAWLSLRYEVLAERGAKCECCGTSADDGAKIQVDHIKPRSKYPELALVKSNLQVLCKACNIGKSNRREDDWRKESKPKRVLVKQH